MPTNDFQLSRILDACQGQAIALFDQWNEERNHQRLNDGAMVLGPLLAKAGAKLLNLNIDPFGCHFTIDDAHFILKVTRKTVGIFELKPTLLNVNL